MTGGSNEVLVENSNSTGSDMGRHYLVAAMYYGLGGSGQQLEAPDLYFLQGIILALIGFLAGVLGGIIGTGGCSVMLPVLHYWMEYLATIAVGTTLFAVIFTAILGGLWMPGAAQFG